MFYSVVRRMFYSVVRRKHLKKNHGVAANADFLSLHQQAGRKRHDADGKQMKCGYILENFPKIL